MFASVGASLILGDIDEVAVTATADAITAAGGAAVALRCDIAKADNEALVGRAVADHGRLDVMGNIAGFPMDDVTLPRKNLTACSRSI